MISTILSDMNDVLWKEQRSALAPNRALASARAPATHAGVA